MFTILDETTKRKELEAYNKKDKIRNYIRLYQDYKDAFRILEVYR